MIAGERRAGEDPVLAEIVRRLVDACQPDRIYLFGSQARGDADEDSDYDLLVVVADDAPPERRSSVIAHRALHGTGVAADVIVYTRSYFEARRHLKASLPGTILREGRLLHEAWVGAWAQEAGKGSQAVDAGSWFTLDDPALVQDTRAWLRKAWSDIRAVEYGMKAEPPILGAVIFHCQQAAEKALRALLAWHDVPFRKTYDLEEIGGACVKIDAALNGIIERAGPLTEYAWKFRYPGEPKSPTREETERALARAREVYDAIVARLPAEVQP